MRQSCLSVSLTAGDWEGGSLLQILGCSSRHEAPFPSPEPSSPVQPRQPVNCPAPGDGSLDCGPGPPGPLDSSGPRGPALRRTRGAAAPSERAPEGGIALGLTGHPPCGLGTTVSYRFLLTTTAALS